MLIRSAINRLVPYQTNKIFLLELPVILTQTFTLFADYIKKKHLDLFPSKNEILYLPENTPSPSFQQ